MKNKILLVILFFLPSLFFVNAEGEKIYRIQIQDYIIHPITAEYIERAIDRAEKENGEALLIILDTPGGLLQTTRSIIKKMMNAKVPIIVYVSPNGSRAASAGVFITLAAHVAAMAPSTHIGAAHPVQMGEEGKKELFKKTVEEKTPKKEAVPDDSVMTEKILQDTLAWVENIASARNRNADWAKEAVTKSASITAEEAKRLGVIDLIAENETELLEKLEGFKISIDNTPVILKTKGLPVQTISMNWRQNLLNVLINPNIAYILLTLGFYGLLFEITHPGSWFPGVSGLICILLAFYSFHIIPTNYAGVLLTVTGLILLALEVFIISHGLLALGGFVCLFFGAVFLMDAPQEFFKLSLRVALPTLLASAMVFGFLVTLVLRTHRRKTETGTEGFVGMIGEADTNINPTGKVSLHGELWNAHAEEPIAKGEPVEILKLENLELHVRRKP